MDEIAELTEKDFKHSIPFKTRRRLIAGKFDSGTDISTLRKFIGLTQDKFAEAVGISVHTLRNWEQGRRKPDGAAISLLRIAARHPKVIKENLSAVA